MNVHLVQCDAAVTAVDCIHSLDELDDFLENVQIKGLGGTDFRPVFAYVEDALERGEFQMCIRDRSTCTRAYRRDRASTPPQG